MDNENSFYVYLHIRKDSLEVFYVGKGKNKRAYSKSDRNKYWKNIVAKCGYYIIIHHKNLNEEDAYLKEIELIDFYGRKDLNKGTLVNVTNGGDGNSGKIVSEETKIKQSIAAKNRPRTNVSEETKLKISNTLKGHPGYNKGGIGIIPNEETRQKMSESAKERGPSFLGKNHSDETKSKISKSLKANNKKGIPTGRQITDETRIKMSESAKKRNKKI